MFASLGYQKCELAESAELEIGFEKIAIYVGQNGLPTHAARQQKDGSWTSKLGHWYDIEHSTPEGVQGLIYGTVETIMKRPLQRESETDHEQENHSS